jgi:hypothetical protein
MFVGSDCNNNGLGDETRVKSRYAEFALGGKGSISKKNEKILSRIV